MDSNNEVPTKAASPTSDYHMGNPNSTNIAGFHQSDKFFPRMPLPSSEGRSNHYKTCMHALSMSWQNHNSAFTLRELWTATMKYQQRQPALPQYHMGNPNSTNIAGFHQSDTLFPRMPLPSSEGRSNHYKTCMHALSMSWQNHNSAFTLRELWTATMKYQQRQPALPQITTWAIQTAQTSQDFINRTHFSLECHWLRQKADQTTIKPVCMHCPCLGKTTTLHWSTLRGLWTATMKYQQRQPAFPQITIRQSQT